MDYYIVAERKEVVALDFEETLRFVIQSLREAGYEPYEQLRAYADTGDPLYITRHNNARYYASHLDAAKLRIFLKKKSHR